MSTFGLNALFLLGACCLLFVAYAYLTRWYQRWLLGLPLSGSPRWGALWPIISAARALARRGALAHHNTARLRACALLTLFPSLAGVLMLLADAAQPAWPWVWHAILPGFTHDLIWHLLWFNASLLGLALWSAAMPWRSQQSPFVPIIWQSLFANLVVILGSAGAIWLMRTLDLRDMTQGARSTLPLFVLQPLGLLVTWIALWRGSRRTLTATSAPSGGWQGDFQWQQAGAPFAWLHLTEFLHKVYAAGLLVMIFFGASRGMGGHVHPLWFLLKVALLLPAMIWLDKRWLTAQEGPQRTLFTRLAAIALLNLALTAATLFWRSAA